MNLVTAKLLIVTFALVLGKVVFLLGFLRLHPSNFFVRNSSEETPQTRSSQGAIKEAHVGRVVIVMIDSLRWDFLYPPDVTVETMNRRMRTVSDLYNQGHARFCLSIARPPTVTMPRLKALTTGIIPDFSDVILNLASKEVSSPSFLSDFRNYKNGKIVFYGDDTWLKMFPNVFYRAEGVTSFFVSDYTEVDLNVTRHLERELGASDWDMMILHYLGVDHIGHLEGPRSKLMGPKLEEMDGVIKRIYEALNRDEKSERPPLLVLTGDHGMSDGGSHGGASKNEIETPIAFFSPAFKKSKPLTRYVTVSQTDFATQMSLLFGLPPPGNSLGRPIQHVADLFRNPDQDVFDGFVASTTILSRQSEEKGFDDIDSVVRKVQDGSWSVQRGISMLSGKSWLLQQELDRQRGGVDVYLMGMALLILAAVLIILLLSWEENPCQKKSLLATISFGVLFLIIHALCLILELRQSNISTTLFLWCPFLFGPLSWLWSWAWLGFGSESLRRFAHRRSAIASSLPRLLPLVVPWAQAFVNLSSSYVEEEHQFWFAFHQLFIFMTLIHVVRPAQLLKGLGDVSDPSLKGQLSPGPVRSCLGVLEKMGRVPSESVVLGCLVFLASFIMRISREWHRTGDKWASLPDVSDWLEAHSFFLWESIIISGFLLACVAVPRPFGLDSIVFLLGLPFALLVHGHRLGTVPGTNSDSTLAILTFLDIFILMGKACHGRNFSSLKSGWLLLGLLLCKPSSVPWLVLLVTSEELIKTLYLKIHLPPDSYVFIFLVFAMSGYFQQGNSNSLSSLELSSGYVGLRFYHPLPTGILLACHTYHPLIYFIFSLMEIFQQKRILGEGRQYSLSSLMYYVLLFLSVQAVFYSAAVMVLRNHLFIFSVFAPKLLYDGMLTLILCSLFLPAIHFLRL